MPNTKKILLVSSAFYPEISPRSFRATELAKELFRQGHDVTVISRYRAYDYSDFLSSYPLTFKMWKKSSLPQFSNFKRMPFSLLGRILSRILMVLFEYPAVEEMWQVKKVLMGEGGYDLMISFAVPYPVHWGVSKIRSAEAPIARTWVADCGDPFMFARLDRFKKPFYFKTYEKKFCRNCNYISVPFDDMRNQFYPEFKTKIEVIPQGFNFDEISLYEGALKNTSPVFIFAGSVIPGKRDLTLFLDFLTSFSTDYMFIVYTNQKEWFSRYKEVLDGKLELRDYIDRLSLIYEISKADFVINVDTIHDDESNTEAIPSKLIDYALSGRPILNINSGNLDKEKVTEFLNKDYSKQRIIDKSNFDIRKVASKFLDLIQD